MPSRNCSFTGPKRLKKQLAKPQAQRPCNWLQGLKLACTLWLVAGCLFISAVESPVVAKKKKGPTEAQLKKDLEPLQKTLTELSQQAQNRLIFGPKESASLYDLQIKTLQLMQDYPAHPLLMQPIFEVGQLFQRKALWLDAYQAYDFVAKSYPNTLYAARATLLQKQVEPQALGTESGNPPPTTLSTPPPVGGAPGTSPAKK